MMGDEKRARAREDVGKKKESPLLKHSIVWLYWKLYSALRACGTVALGTPLWGTCQNGPEYEDQKKCFIFEKNI